MSIGKTARAVLGKHFHALAKIYRSVFINLDTLADVLSSEIPQNALVLDVGGGDGAPLNNLFQRRPDLRVIMLDLAPEIGGAIENRYISRVEKLPSTQLSDYGGPPPDVICVMDVLHHVPAAKRMKFFKDVAVAAKVFHVPLLLIKDIQPGHFRSLLSYIADVYVSADRSVSLICFEDVTKILEDLIPGVTITCTPLLRRDNPNYCLAIRPG